MGRRSGSIKAIRRQTVYDRDGNQCLRCGATEDLTVDHILPLARGGTNCHANLQTLCRPCNEAKADHSISYREDTCQSSERD